MLKSAYIDPICMVVLAAAVFITVLFMNGESLGIVSADTSPEYVSRLFDDSYVHTIDLQVEDWQSFIENATDESYIPCTVVIDGKRFFQVGLRAKGNNSLRLTKKYESPRYSLKLEFDHYLGGGNYYGLDKFSLDASFQDNSSMKTFLAYDMMDYMGVPAPLCSYTWVTVNGQSWGLFLAVEEPEEAFAQRNFGDNYGRLYKPDYRSLNDENTDVALGYITDDTAGYENIFRNSKFDVDEADRRRLVEALYVLNTEENLESAVNVDQVLRYFSVQVFVMNWDSYIGPTGHNYFLYEENGQISMLPWDYNLAFGTYCLGKTRPIKNPNLLINYPVDTPWEGGVMLNRPLFHRLMKQNEYFARYHRYLEELALGYVESGRCELLLRQTAKMIAPYIEKDPTAFCSYADHQRAVETLIEVCRLRMESVSGQLKGKYPSTLRERNQQPFSGVDASYINLQDLGDFEDLKNHKIP